MKRPVLIAAVAILIVLATTGSSAYIASGQPSQEKSSRFSSWTLSLEEPAINKSVVFVRETERGSGYYVVAETQPESGSGQWIIWKIGAQGGIEWENSINREVNESFEFLYANNGGELIFQSYTPPQSEGLGTTEFTKFDQSGTLLTTSQISGSSAGYLIEDERGYYWVDYTSGFLNNGSVFVPSSDVYPNGTIMYMGSDLVPEWKFNTTVDRVSMTPDGNLLVHDWVQQDEQVTHGNIRVYNQQGEAVVIKNNTKIYTDFNTLGDRLITISQNTSGNDEEVIVFDQNLDQVYSSRDLPTTSYEIHQTNRRGIIISGECTAQDCPNSLLNINPQGFIQWANTLPRNYGSVQDVTSNNERIIVNYNREEDLDTISILLEVRGGDDTEILTEYRGSGISDISLTREGDIFADFENGTIRRLDERGNTIWRDRIEDEDITSSFVGRDGNYYLISDQLDSFQIYQYSRDGNRQNADIPGNLRGVVNLYNGTGLIVAETGNSAIDILLSEIGSSGPRTGENGRNPSNQSSPQNGFDILINWDQIVVQIVVIFATVLLAWLTVRSYESND